MIYAVTYMGDIWLTLHISIYMSCRNVFWVPFLHSWNKSSCKNFLNLFFIVLDIESLSEKLSI